MAAPDSTGPQVLVEGMLDHYAECKIDIRMLVVAKLAGSLPVEVELVGNSSAVVVVVVVDFAGNCIVVLGKALDCFLLHAWSKWLL